MSKNRLSESGIGLAESGVIVESNVLKTNLTVDAGVDYSEYSAQIL